MTSFKSQHVLIVGAGLAGSLLACSMARLGFRVTVAERRADPRRAGVLGGRSINLALSCRGITALRREGLDGQVLADAIAMRGRMLHDPSGTLTFQPYSANTADAINSVSRSKLNLAMLDAAAAFQNVRFRFDLRCVDVDSDAAAAEFRVEPTGETVTIEVDAIIGADGAFSAVRGAMQRTDRFDYSQTYLEHGFKELLIPPARECGVDPDEHDGFAMDPHALHIWPRGGSMMIALPNADRTFTCTIFWPFHGAHGFDAIDPDDAESVREFFTRRYPDAAAIMPTLEREYRINPVGSLVTVRCSPWQIGSRLVLVGDAAHAIVPFFGQGINAGFEDCRILVELIEQLGELPQAIERYAQVRTIDADAIADMALENFVEMRDTVGHEAFLYAKRIEQTLHAHMPDRVEPKYNLVSFSNIPYAQAKQRGEEFAALVGRVAEAVPMSESRTLTDDEWRARVIRHGEQLLGLH